MASIYCRYLDGTTHICNSTDCFSDIMVNGESIGLLTDYNVDSGDEVEFVLNITKTLTDSFKSCETLVSVVIGDGVKCLRGQTFQYCTVLETIEIGKDVFQISGQPFFFCYNLMTIRTRSPHIEVDTDTFSYSGSVSKFPKGGTLYYPTGENYTNWFNAGLANREWSGVENASLSEPYSDLVVRCTYKGNTLTYYTDWFSDILVNGESIGLVNSYDISDGDEVEFVLKHNSIPKSAFYDTSIKTAIIPEGVDYIGNLSFANNHYLQKVDISRSVKFVDFQAFWNCYKYSYDTGVGFTTILERSPLLTVRYNTFESVDMYGTLYIPTGGSGVSYYPEPLVSPYTLAYDYKWKTQEVDFPIFELDTDLIEAPYTGLQINVGVYRENILSLDIEKPEWLEIVDKGNHFAIDIFENDGAKRSDYILFIINKDDITETIVKLKVMQEEMELPENLKPIWKDYEYTFGGSDVTYGIYTETRYVPPGGRPQDVVYIDNLIFKGRAYATPNESVVKVNLNKICQNYLGESSLVFDGAVGVGNSFNKFKLKDGYGNLLETLYFVGDWSYKPLTLGIKTNPITPNIANGQKLFFSLLAEDSRSVQWGMKYSDATEDYTNTEYLSNGFETVIVPKSREKNVRQFHFGGKNYNVLPKCQCKWVLYYLNPYGGYDWFTITGKVTRRDRLQTYTINRNYNNTTTNFGKKRYLSTIDINYQINTQWLSQAQSDRMWELLESNQVWLHNLETDEIMPVIITDTDIEHKQKTRTNKMISYQINVELSQSRERM